MICLYIYTYIMGFYSCKKNNSLSIKLCTHEPGVIEIITSRHSIDIGFMSSLSDT